MDKEKQACWNCRWFRALYTKGYCHFDKCDFGKCAKTSQTVEKHNLCELWELKTQTFKRYNRFYSREAARNALTEILQQLIEVAQILKEEHEENKIDPIPELKPKSKSRGD